jgi:hypothetical protein
VDAIMKYAVVQSEEVVNVILINPEDFNSFKEQFLAENPNVNLVEIPENLTVGPGCTYNSGKFFPKKPFERWVFNEEIWTWLPPTPRPGEGYYWSQEEENWLLRTTE